MKINQTILTLILFALCAGLVIWVFSERSKRQDAENKLSSSTYKKTGVDLIAPKVQQKIDSLKQQHGIFTTDATIVDGKRIAVSKPLLDSIAKAGADNIKSSEVSQWQNIAFSLEARAMKAERGIDSLKRVNYVYKDRFVNLSYMPGNPLDTTDKGLFNFAYNADLSVLQYTKRAKFLGLPIGAKHTYTNIYSNDPRTTINSLKTLTVEQKQPTFGFRAQLVSNYSFQRGTVLIGPGAQIDAGRFSLVGTYYYNPRDNSFAPALGVRYDVIR